MKDSDFYKILGVSIYATNQEIKSAYHNKIKMFHPDTYLGNKEKAENITASLNQAYCTLRDFDKRAEYDKKMGFDVLKRKQKTNNKQNSSTQNSNVKKHYSKQNNNQSKSKTEKFKDKSNKHTTNQNNAKSVKSENSNGNLERIILDSVIIVLLVIVIVLLFVKI